jgi:hypothetical protein
MIRRKPERVLPAERWGWDNLHRRARHGRLDRRLDLFYRLQILLL